MKTIEDDYALNAVWEVIAKILVYDMFISVQLILKVVIKSPSFNKQQLINKTQIIIHILPLVRDKFKDFPVIFGTTINIECRYLSSYLNQPSGGWGRG